MSIQDVLLGMNEMPINYKKKLCYMSTWSNLVLTTNEEL
jgi:hypothetical protein